jgi:hypothetical protein
MLRYPVPQLSEGGRPSATTLLYRLGTPGKACSGMQVGFRQALPGARRTLTGAPRFSEEPQRLHLLAA